MTIRPARAEDRRSHLGLLRFFDRRPPAALWRWKYFSPWRDGTGPTVLLARDGAGPVSASVAYLPLRMRLAGRVAPACWLTDFIVAPVRRRRGVGARLLSACASLPRPQMVLGLQPAGMRVALAGGFRERAGLEFWARPLPSTAPKVRSGLHAEPIGRFPPEMDRLEGELARGYRLMVVRDRRYLDWRYNDIPMSPNPYRKYLIHDRDRPRGLLVIRDSGAAAVIDELFVAADDVSALRFCLRHAEASSRRAGARRLKLLVDERRGPWICELRRAGWLPLFEAPGLVCRGLAHNDLAKLSLHVSAGDSDLDLAP